MEDRIKYLGSYRPKSEDFLRSTVTINGDSHHVWDAVGATADGHNFARLLPNVADNAELVNLVQDGDLIGYIRGPMTISWPCKLDANTALGILKGRVSHTELGYAGDDGCPMQTSIFNEPGPRVPRDRPIYEDFDNAALGIYRASLREYGITPKHEAALKAEVKRWRRIVQPVIFPCKDMDTDPVDFTTVEALSEIGAECIKHSPNDHSALFDFKLNCVQWSTLVFSLAVCFPLSSATLASKGWVADYERNWREKLGLADDEKLTGLEELPIPFYTLDEVIDNTLDLYLFKVKQQVRDMIPKDAVTALMFSKGIRPDQRSIMPSAFMAENRLRAMGIKRKTKTVFGYIATVMRKEDLVQIGG